MINTLHIAPGYSAGASLSQAIRDVRPSDDILRWPDDLSCGPIDTENALARAVWWGYTDDDWKLDLLIKEFWDRVDKSHDKLVVWFARHCAMEHAFFLNWTARLNHRPFEIIDVTGLQVQRATRDGKLPIEHAVAASLLRPRSLAALIGTERALSSREKDDACRRWGQLRNENAPFRIVSEDGLVSAPENYFDQSLLSLANKNWQRLARLLGDAMHENNTPYVQVLDRALHTRLVALLNEGKLMAEGDPWDIRNCRVRLAN